MKTVRNVAEAVKLFTFSCLTIAVPLVVVLSIGAYKADVFIVPSNNTSNVLLTNNTSNVLLTNSTSNVLLRNNNLSSPANLTLRADSKLSELEKPADKRDEKVQETCDIFDGKWVFDPEASPLYDSAQCPFLGEQVSCQRNGRLDSDYEKWTWEPKGCHNIPRKNIGKQMLEKLRNKRVIMVGDSLNRNQWESMACILYTSLAPSKGHVDDGGIYKLFTAKDYNCTVEFYWSPFLVQSVKNPKTGDWTLKLNKLVPSAKMWKGADVMVFNTGHWWSHSAKYQTWGAKNSKGNQVEMETETALGLAMETWSRWIDKNVDPTKTRVFFRSISPEHKGQQWCYNQTGPITDGSYVERYPQRMREIVERRVQGMRTPITYLNITGLSGYRKDGHPSIYKTKQGKNLVASNETRPETYADCSHWCLPGVPDTWNILWFASMLSDTSMPITFS